MNNISPNWKGSTRRERRICQSVLKKEGTPNAIRYFDRHCKDLGDYWYWFLLSTLWVSYTGHSDLNLWKSLFSSTRKGRDESIMKPDEFKMFKTIPESVTAYRAHRKDETDWIAYTFDHWKAVNFAVKRGVNKITAYKVLKQDIMALFLRRGENELIVLNKSKAVFDHELRITIGDNDKNLQQML